MRRFPPSPASRSLSRDASISRLEPRFLLSVSTTGDREICDSFDRGTGTRAVADPAAIDALPHSAEGTSSEPPHDSGSAGDPGFSHAGSVWSLSSLPGAPATIYLDFDGEPARRWSSHTVPETPAYDTDDDSSFFSARELASIIEIWKRVSEKFSPFNVNVTTARPAGFANGQALQVIIGGDGAWTGSRIGGVAQMGSFTNSASNTVWVFEDHLWDGHPKATSEVAAHEAGHALGLEHQSRYDVGGNLLEVYSRGDATRAPIMGSSFNSKRGLWWNGTTDDSRTYQDDLSILAGDRNGFGYRPDEHGGSAASATALTLSGESAARSVAASGIVHHVADQEWFRFTTGAGSIRLVASVAEHGPMLDLKLGLHDQHGNVIAAADTSSLGESLTATVAAGTYYISIASHGGYGDVGQFTLSGTLPASDADSGAASEPVRRISRTARAATVAGDQLLITGTESADSVAVHYDAETDQLVVMTNGQEETFPAGGLTGLRVQAGAGDDTVRVHVSVTLAAAIFGGEGNDSLDGGGGADLLFGGEGDDLITGGNGHDLLRGGGGNDEIHGNGGNDSLWGHGGDDILLGGDDSDLLRGGGGGDTLKGDAGGDTILGHEGDDDVMGHDGNDLIRGHAGRDRLFAGRGLNALDGGDDDDELDASLGENVVLGGRGSDIFVGDKQANIFADYETQSDWVAAMLTDARDGGVQRWRDESTGFFTPDHPAYEQLVAAFERDASDVEELRSAYARPGGNADNRAI